MDFHLPATLTWLLLPLATNIGFKHDPGGLRRGGNDAVLSGLRTICEASTAHFVSLHKALHAYVQDVFLLISLVSVY